MAKIYTFNNKIVTINNKWAEEYVEPVDPYNPLGLPPYTIRVRTSDGNAPVKGAYTSYETATLVSGTSDVYDVYKQSSDWTVLLNGASNLLEVLGANTSNVTIMNATFNNCQSLTTIPLFDTSNVTNMQQMFNRCISLTSVPLFDTSNVTIVYEMFSGCTALTSVPLFNTSNVIDMASMLSNCTALSSIPLFNTSKVTNMSAAFGGCTNVESGALALYQQASTQTTPPSNHSYTFRNCGSNTVTGAAELAQIPSSWGGTGA